MRKYGLFCLTSILMIILGACNKLVTTDDLIGGKLVPISGYKDGKPSGEPACAPYDKGIAFKDEETVYVESRDQDFSYDLGESEEGIEIVFLIPMVKSNF